MKSPTLEPTLDLPRRETEQVELPERDDSMLRSGKLGQQHVT
jgi:hypothetical protein